MAKDSKYGDIDVPGIPDDEPIFIIRAQDKSAPQAVNQYANTASTNGSPSSHTAECRLVSAAMKEWQVANPDKVKAGD